MIGPAVADEHVQQREGQRRVAARMGLEVQVGLLSRRRADRVDHDHRARRLGQPLRMGVRGRRRRVRAPHDDALGVARGARVKARLRRAVQVAEGDMASQVADGVRLDLGRSNAVEEP